MLTIQYDLFLSKEQAELLSLKKEISDTKKSSDKVRKALFARHNELAKQFIDLKNEHDLIIKHICKGNILFKEVDNASMLRSDGTKNRKVESIESSFTPGTFEENEQCLLAMRM